MIDSKQVRKLPVHWLLAPAPRLPRRHRAARPLLPQKHQAPDAHLDHFPLLCRRFSVLIYWIGYHLRAGETEWNELKLGGCSPARHRAPSHARGAPMSPFIPPSTPITNCRAPSNSLFHLPRRIRAAATAAARKTAGAPSCRTGDGFVADVHRPRLDQPALCQRLAATGGLASRSPCPSPAGAKAGRATVENITGHDLCPSPPGHRPDAFTISRPLPRDKTTNFRRQPAGGSPSAAFVNQYSRLLSNAPAKPRHSALATMPSPSERRRERHGRLLSRQARTSSEGGCDVVVSRLSAGPGPQPPCRRGPRRPAGMGPRPFARPARSTSFTTRRSPVRQPPAPGRTCQINPPPSP